MNILKLSTHIVEYFLKVSLNITKRLERQYAKLINKQINQIHKDT
jgi:hypothetical protein